MASGVQGPKQTKGYFVTLAPLVSSMQFVNTGSSGAGGTYVPGVMTGSGGAGAQVSSIAANSMLKDMGKTVVSSTRTFRKVQLMVPNGPSVSSQAAATGMPFYIELSTGQTSQANAAQVAYLPGLM
jgi:hypothetical protein